jgi:hypothetical protein
MQPGPLMGAIEEALTKSPPGDDPRRRILAIELRSVAAELDADPTGRPALIAVLERLVAACFPIGVTMEPDQMELEAWLSSVYGSRS